MSTKQAAKTKSSAMKKTNVSNGTRNSSQSEVLLNAYIQNEISRLVESQDVDKQTLEEFAHFVINNYKRKPPKPKPLSLSQLKEAIYKYFEVKNTSALKRSGSFKMATDGMGDLNLSVKETWEKLYREFIGILPNEENQRGYGCVNGINIFNYFKPWQVFGLDPKTATSEDIKTAYRELSKIYHPDIPKTGDAQVFNRINTLYRSISAEA